MCNKMGKMTRRVLNSVVQNCLNTVVNSVHIMIDSQPSLPKCSKYICWRLPVYGVESFAVVISILAPHPCTWLSSLVPQSLSSRHAVVQGLLNYSCFVLLFCVSTEFEWWNSLYVLALFWRFRRRKKNRIISLALEKKKKNCAHFQSFWVKLWVHLLKWSLFIWKWQHKCLENFLLQNIDIYAKKVAFIQGASEEVSTRQVLEILYCSQKLCTVKTLGVWQVRWSAVFGKRWTELIFSDSVKRERKKRKLWSSIALCWSCVLSW